MWWQESRKYPKSNGICGQKNLKSDKNQLRNRAWFCILSSSIKTGELTIEPAERKLSDFDPLPDAGNAAVGSHDCCDFLQELPVGQLLLLYKKEDNYMTTTEQLLNATKEIWDSYYEHPFVKGIGDGSLDREKFRYYIIQDYLYLEEYAKTFAIGIAKAKSPETTQLFSGYINLLTGSEMDIHRGYMGKFAVSREELNRTKRALDNLSYTSYMLRVAYEEGEAEILAAILSCAYSYELIGRNLAESNPDCVKDEFYGDWITGYASEEYHQGNVVLIDMLDRLTENYTQAQIDHLTDIFVACSRYEYLFWDFSWEMKN